MKILSTNICFKLPDNFEGTFVDALDLFIQHQLANKNPTINEKGDDVVTGLSDTELSEHRNAYRKVMEAHSMGTSQKAAFSYALCELDSENNVWKSIKVD